MIERFQRLLVRNKIKKLYPHNVGIKVGNNVDLLEVEMEDYVNLAHHAQISNSKIGKRTSIGRYSKIQYATIGRYCSISWDATIGATVHPMKSISTHAFTYRKQFGISSNDFDIGHDLVNIDNDVWIGCNSVIMPGVHIGNGAIIGASAVVTHDVKSFEIVAGVPARHVGWRFGEDICRKLEQLEWWNLSDEILKNNISFFDVDKEVNLLMLDEFEKRITTDCEGRK